MNIQLTEREAQFLKQYAEVYESERKIDSTANPIVVVEAQQDIPADADYGYDKVTYIWDMGSCYDEYELEEELKENDFTSKERDEIFAELEETGEALGGSIQRVFVNILWAPAAYFLTRAEAEKYCQYQKHNLKNPRVYSRYVGYRNNGDLDCLMGLLLRMGKELSECEAQND